MSTEKKGLAIDVGGLMGLSIHGEDISPLGLIEILQKTGFLFYTSPIVGKALAPYEITIPEGEPIMDVLNKIKEKQKTENL